VRTGVFASSGAPDDTAHAHLTGLVPDGVAKVTLEYPRVVPRGRWYKPTVYRRAYQVTLTVVDNVLSARVPRPPTDAFPNRMVWRAADGAVVRTVRAPR
jgi:hypothetical protein